MLEETKKVYTRSSHNIPRFRVFKKDEGGIPRSTGRHIIKILEEKLTTGKNYQTQKEQEEMHYLIEENGINRVWIIAIDSYLIGKLVDLDINIGDKIMVEGGSSGGTNFTRILKVGDGTAIDYNAGEDEGGVGENKDGEDFSDKESEF